jgi:hypothetical protein
MGFQAVGSCGVPDRCAATPQEPLLNWGLKKAQPALLRVAVLMQLVRLTSTMRKG